jgi:hypothetical protein
MLKPATAPQITIDRGAHHRMGAGTRAAVPWRALVAVALLLLTVAAGLYEALPGRGGLTTATVSSRGLVRQGLLSLPTAAQGPVSAALGADSPAYRVRASGRGYGATSPAEHLSSSFTPSGASVSAGATRVGLRLLGVGYLPSLRAIGPVSPRVRANRVLYEHPGVSEWYANGPLGLEQGFTIAKPPGAHAAGPLTLAIALSGNARAALQSGGRGITLSRPDGGALRYTGLSASDARGGALHSWIALQGKRILLRVDASRARYPLRIDPFVQQGKKLTGGGGSGFSGFGHSVALSADGNTALIGGAGDNAAVGAAWVFTRSGETWTQQGPKLTGGGESGQGQFGSGVALSADGNTALIGGQGDERSAGAAWVFTRSGETWTQQGEKLTGAGEIGAASFGHGVALSSDGNTALIGGINDNGAAGAAWVFTRSLETWTQQAKLTGAGTTFFGWSVALSSDGNTALVGSPGDSELVGAAFVFTRSGLIWTQQGEKLTGGGAVGAPRFGISVALSSDGNTALIGGTGDHSFAGAAWVFTRSLETWTQQGGKLTGGGESGEGAFGSSVALSAEGNTALIGGSGDNKGVGAAWAFTRSGETWTQQGSKLTGAGESGEGEFGSAAALSAEGSTALIGGPQDNGVVGAAWVFVPGTAPQCPANPPKVNVRWHYSANGSPGKWSVTGEAKCGQTITLGPQAMEGNLKVNPGAKLKAGYDFTLPRNKSTFTVSFTEGKVVFAARCVSGKAPSESTFTVPLADQSYLVTNANWYPSGEQKSPLTYQGEIAVPNLCAGGQLKLDKGGTFSAFMTMN